MAFYESQHTYLKVCLGSLSFYSVCTAVLVMPLHIIHRSSSLYLACLRTSLNCLCFSWALCSANWILPLSKVLSCFLPIVLARWDFSFPYDINFFCCTTTEVQSSTGCSHDNSLSSMQLMLGTLVPCQCINKLICILGVSRQAYDEECWLTQTIIDFLKGFLENTIQVMWLVWTRQSPFELAPWQYLCLSWFENFRQWFGRFARRQHHLRQQRWLLQLAFLSFSSAQPLVSWFPHNLSSWRTIPQNRLSLPTFSMIWTICNWAS